MEITALLVSLLALGFSIYSVVETHRTNRLTNRPAIVGHETKGWNEYKYELVNKGTGPAYLKEVEWFWCCCALKIDQFCGVMRAEN